MGLELFAKLIKVDEENRLVYGRAADETPDRSGEVFDYRTSKPLFQKWSDETQEASDGQSLGNLRAMHGKVAAGKLTGIDFDDANKAVNVVAKVVDDNEWKKVLEGVYTGFSIGGAYANKWDDPSVKKSDGKAAKRYTAAPSELSLVDRPCIPSAKFFDIRKADGATEQHEFKSVLTDARIEAVARELVKATGFDPDSTDTTDGVNQPLWKAYTGQATEHLQAAGPVESEKEEAMTEKAAAPGDQIEYQVEGTDDEVAKLAQVMHDEKLNMADVLSFVDACLVVRKADAEVAAIKKAEADGELKKGMYLVGQVAYLVQQLESIQQSIVNEETREKDAGSVLPAKAGNLLAVAIDLLRAMVEEESAEVLAGDDDDGTIQPSILAMAHFGDLKKIGARNSANDAERIKKMHDLAVELGATCGSKEAAHGSDGLTKADGVLAKADVEGIVEGLLAKVREDNANALAKMESVNAELREKVEKLEAQPAPSRAVLRVVHKGHDVEADDEPAVQPVLNKAGQVNEAASLIKMMHQSGGVHLGLRPDGSSIL